MRACFNRRDFLKRSLLIGTAFSAYPGVGALALEPFPKDISPRRKSVIVIGAGLAGLSSAHVLTQAGYDVLVLEARNRPGGRIETLEKEFSDGLYAEAGASFVSSLHSLTMKYIRDFGLELDTVLPADKALCYYTDKIHNEENKFIEVPSDHPLGIGRLATSNGVLAQSPWPQEINLYDREWQDGLYVMISKYCQIGRLGDCTDSAWPTDGFKPHDTSFAAFLQNSSGASPAAIELMRPWFAPWWDDLDKVSALHLRRDAALGFALGVPEKVWYTIRGGMKQLPIAFANRLAGNIRYGSPVIEIKPDSTSVGVSYLDLKTNTYREVKGDHLICATPFSVLREIKGIERFSAEKQKAINELPYSSITRVYLQCKDRSVWTSQNWKGVLYTNRPIMNLMDSTFCQQGSRGILHAFMSGDQARAIAAKPQQERIEFVLGEVKNIYDKIDIEQKHCTSKCWDEDEWARGACAYFKPGQVHELAPHLASAEGRVHFAGDHTSAWSGWMQGALQSGHRAACEIALAP